MHCTTRDHSPPLGIFFRAQKNEPRTHTARGDRATMQFGGHQLLGRRWRHGEALFSRPIIGWYLLIKLLL